MSMNEQPETNEASPSGLDSAPDHIKLAVDLIYLLEENQVDIKTALDALEIVKQDLLSRA